MKPLPLHIFERAIHAGLYVLSFTKEDRLGEITVRATSFGQIQPLVASMAERLDSITVEYVGESSPEVAPNEQ